MVRFSFSLTAYVAVCVLCDVCPHFRSRFFWAEIYAGISDLVLRVYVESTAGLGIFVEKSVLS